jgi:Sel1 repeat
MTATTNQTVDSVEFVSPSLPPLYFSQGEPLQACGSESAVTLPAEILSLCLNHYSTWGDVARLACVQKSWQFALQDAAATSEQHRWTLAQAYLHGTHGLAPHPTRAVSLLTSLTNIPVDPTNNHPVFTAQQQEQLQQISANDNENSDDDENDSATTFVPAIRALADVCFEGVETAGANIPRDCSAGIMWLQAAIMVGKDVPAAYRLAQIYERGTHDIPVDVVQAANWFRYAAQRGHVEAMAEYALCLELGCGVDVDDEMALEWYVKAANAGHVTAKYSVGEAFEEARGVPQSDTEACLWYYKAALVGDQDSLQALRRLADIARIVIPGVGVLLDV